MTKTLLLTRSEVESCLDPHRLIPVLKSAFQSYSLNPGIRPKRVFSPASPGSLDGAMVLFPGWVADIPAYTVKVHAKFPDGDPAIRGLILLHDRNSGKLLSVMDSTHVTSVRTGLSGALGTHLLARENARNLSIIGVGVQGRLQLRSLLYFRRLSQVFVYDLDPDKSNDFCEAMKGFLSGVPIQPVSSHEEAVTRGDIVITATWSRKPFIFLDQVRPGTHITTLGPDQPGKCEVDAEVIRHSVFVCDDRHLAAEMGALAGAGLGEEFVHAELGEIIAGIRSGRTSPDQVTVFGAVGLPFQDLVAAWQVYQEARRRGIGQQLDFLA